MKKKPREARIGQCVRYRMNLPQFRQFADKVCEDVCRLVGCSFQLWDSYGNKITNRHKPHKLCEWLRGNDFVLNMCQQDDVPVVKKVLRENTPQEYQCWAGFTCFMVPIRVANITVGAISVGEFLTEENSELTQEFWHMSEKINIYRSQIDSELSNGRVKCLLRTQVESLRKVTLFLTEIISDIISDKLTEATCSEYFDKLETKIELFTDEADGKRLAYRIIRSLYNLFLSRAQIFAESLQQLRLHHILTPLTELMYISETIADSDVRYSALRLIRECDKQVRLFITPDQILSTLWICPNNKEMVTIRPFLESVVADFKQRLDLSDSFLIEVPLDLTLLIASEHLREIISNLIDNAIKATDPPRRIVIVAERSDDEVKIEVRDNGCGIEENQMERILSGAGSGENFISRGWAGSGQGLRLVSQLAARNWGELKIESNIGEGTTISVAFSQMEV